MAEAQLPAGAARSKGLGCCPTSRFVYTEALLAGARPSARAHDFP